MSNEDNLKVIKQNFELLVNKNTSLIKLELGCGQNKRHEEAIGIDIIKSEKIDITFDLNNGLPFINDNSIDIIYCYHFLEHIENLNTLMQEIYRVLKIGGKLIGTVPHFSNPYYYSDPTHKTFFGLYTFCYFSKTSYFKRKVPSFYNNLNFEIKSLKLHFSSPFFLRNKIKNVLQRFINLNKYTQEFYEENLAHIIPCYEIEFELTKLP